MDDIKPKDYENIEDYGIIGDLHTVALISQNGSLDFMSFTRFDSPTVFARLLDAKKGGYFCIHPEFDHVSSRQLYLPDTAILVTRFFADEGIAEITDYMPVDKKESNCAVIRKVTTVRGKINFNMECRPRFDYARARHTAILQKDGCKFESDDELKTSARLLSSIPIHIQENDASAHFTLTEGESAYFIFESIPNENERPQPLSEYINYSYRCTLDFWQKWCEKSTYRGRWRETVLRSAITLKLLTSRKFGSVIAAPTFSLPEAIGSERNWDYRYTWIRDAAFTMYALLQLGFNEEATEFIKWIKAQCMEKPLQLMYAVDGNTDLEEQILDHLEGYKGSKPVRIGNKAHEQFQLDIYGELIDTIYLFNKYVTPITFEFWQEIQRQVDCVIENWRKPDHGIWEIRNEKKQFLHSRVMCWVAIDRAIKIAINRSFPCPIEQWRAVRNDIYMDVYNNFWNEEKQSYIQYLGTDAVDASVLLMPMMRFISPIEKRWKSTLAAVEKELKSDVLIYRYRNNLPKFDGIDGEEGTFTMCSFWYVECLAKSGRVEEARDHFEKMLGYTNHLGLFSEELGHRGEHLGNYPQAFTHLALISAALELDKDLEKHYSPVG